jgi:hypothetical protein
VTGSMSSIAADGKGEPNTVEEETWPAPNLSGESCKQTALTLTATIPWPILSWLHRRRVVISPPTRLIGSSRVRILLAWAENKISGWFDICACMLRSANNMALVLACLAANQSRKIR